MTIPAVKMNSIRGMLGREKNSDAFPAYGRTLIIKPAETSMKIIPNHLSMLFSPATELLRRNNYIR
jgi:hypothetical protein